MDYLVPSNRLHSQLKIEKDRAAQMHKRVTELSQQLEREQENK